MSWLLGVVQRGAMDCKKEDEVGGGHVRANIRSLLDNLVMGYFHS